MINRNNYAVYKEGKIRIVGLIVSNNTIYVPGWGYFNLEIFNLPAKQEDAEKCQSEIDARDEYYNHKVGTAVANNFDIIEWRKSRKKYEETICYRPLLERVLRGNNVRTDNKKRCR